MQRFRNAQRNLVILGTILVVLLSVFGASQFFGSHPTKAATKKSIWTHVNHKGQQDYWASRLGNVTGADLAAARAKAAKLPTASQLPPSNRWGPAVSTPQPPSGVWHPIGPAPIDVSGVTTFAGRVSALAVDQTTSGPNTIIYLGAAGGGGWKSVNNGASWTPLTDSQASLATGAIAIDPNNHNIIYVGTGEPNQSVDSFFGNGILKSTNGGTTWTLLGAATFGDRQGGAIAKIIVNPRNSQQLFVASTLGLYLSSDGGSSYALASGVPATIVDDLGINATTNPVTVYATVRGSGMWRSADGGTTWGNLTTGLPAAGSWFRSALAVAPSNPSVVYTVITQDDTSGAVYVPGTYNGGYYTTNGGTSWNPMASLNQNFTDGGFGAQGWYDLYLAVDPKNDQTVYGGGVDIAITTNARGASGNWQNITSVYGADNSNIHPDQHAIAFPACTAAPCPAYFGNDGGVYFSSNTTTANPANVTYTDLNTAGLAITEFTGGDVGPNFTNARLALGGTQDNGTMRYTSNPVWPEVYGGDGGFAVIDQQHPSVMYTENFGVTLVKSTNGGTTWVDATAGGQLTGSSLFYMPYMLDRSNDQHLVAGTDSVYETITGTSSWYKSSQTFGTSVSAVAVAPGNSAVIYAGLADGETFRATNGNTGSAATFTPGQTLGHYINSITVDPADSTGTTAYATGGLFYQGQNGYIWKTTTGGASWASIAGPLPNYPINTAVAYYSGSTRVVVIGTDYGVYFTTSDGATWTRLAANLPDVPVEQLAMDTQRTTLIAYTHGRSAFSINIPETAGGTGDTIGIFRPSNATFYLRNSLTTGPADETVAFGTSSDTPVAGDWNGDGIDTIGVYRSSTATFLLKDSNAPGAPITHTFTFGNPGDVPLVGDWTGSGHDGVGVFRPSNGIVYLRNSLSTGFSDYSMVFGNPGDAPVAGDWNADGIDSIGIYRPSTGIFYLTNTNCNCIPPADYVLAFGNPGDAPFAGDWTHAGRTGLGVFRPSNGIVYLKNDPTTTGFSDFFLIYGVANDKPIAGHWNTSVPSAPQR